MTNLDALIEFLAKEEPANLELLAADPTAAAHYLRTEYLPDTEPEDLAPDGQEAAEAATLGESYLLAAGRTWWKLTPDARAALLVIFETATGKQSVSVLNEFLGQLR